MALENRQGSLVEQQEDRAGVGGVGRQQLGHKRAQGTPFHTFKCSQI